MMNLKELNNISGSLNSTERMPVLFIGHGSPMNAIEDNEFVRGWEYTGGSLPKPAAILCVSAHWETRGTRITAMEKPVTIHDFGGFPPKLYEVQYPAPGSPLIANETKKLIEKTEVGLDEKWGLDHGAWSVLKHLFPQADVPVLEMSLDYYQTPRYHYELAQELAPLRRKGILIIGSGNMVHNLAHVDWQHLNEPGYGYDWALEANAGMKELIQQRNYEKLMQYSSLGKAWQLAVPTPEHFLPLLYVLALQEKDEEPKFFNDKVVGGSLSMTCVKFSDFTGSN
jgi:4,5-DOPA dioxygenase extradiol